MLLHAQSAGSPLLRPGGLAYDAARDLFIADSARHQVIEIAVGGDTSVIAGTGTQGSSGDGGPASAAQLNSPSSVAVAPDGTLYIADTNNNRIRAVQNGSISTVAGTGTPGYSGDGGAASSAKLNHPIALALDSMGGLLVCDQGNQRIRRISAGQIATVAGNGTQGFSGDGGRAIAAELNEPSGIAVRSDGSILIADTGNERIRMVSTVGVLSTLAGTGTAGSSGDNGPATAAQLDRPAGLAVDGAGNLFVADENNHRLRRIAPDGTMTTVAGAGIQGVAPDGAVALTASQNLPLAVAISTFGWPVIADPANHSVQIVYSDGKLYSPGALGSRPTGLTQTTSAAVYGTAETVVTAAGTPGAPQGTIRILDGGTPVANAPLMQGRATVPLPALGVGTHTLTAAYSGDGLHPAATATSSVTITPAPVTATASSATLSYGAPLASLTGTLSGVLPEDQAAVSAVFSVNTPSTPGVGTYPITAMLTGSASANYSLSLAPGSGSLTIVPAATTATLTPPVAAYATLPLQLTARIASTTSGTPTGTVQFFDNGALVATAPLVNGSASAIELSPASGNHTLSVAYSGDTNFRASTSANLLSAVNALPDFTIGVSGNTQQTALAGSPASFNLAVASQAAPFTGAVTFSTTGLPAGATVTFSPPAVVPGASNPAVTMTVVAPATTARRRSAQPELTLAATGVFSLLLLRRRRAMARLLALFAVAAVFGITGCGARVASESVLPAKTYPITVKATGTNLAGNVVVHTVNVTLAVE